MIQMSSKILLKYIYKKMVNLITESKIWEFESMFQDGVLRNLQSKIRSYGLKVHKSRKIQLKG